MATSNGHSGSTLKSNDLNPNSSIISDILISGRSYGLLQLMHIIGPENISFKTKISLSPTPNVVEAIKPIGVGTSRMKFSLTVNKFNLLGAEGPMPISYTEMILQMAPKNRAPVTQFLDIFSDKFLRLHFKIKQKYLIGLDNTHPSQSLFFKMLSSIAGGDIKTEDKQLRKLRRSFASFAALMFTQPKSLSALEIFLQSLYGVDIKIKPFIGKWRKFEEEQSFVLGNGRLNTNKFIGDKTWIQDDSVEIIVGPMSSQKLDNFISDGNNKLMQQQIRNLLPPHINYKISYEIEKPTDEKNKINNHYLGYNLFLNNNN